MMTVIVNAQSIEEQATKAGNDAFTNTMIRNVLIIAGVAVVFSCLNHHQRKPTKKV